MFKRTKLSTSLMIAFSGALIGTGMAVQAQGLERVEVTGSRIASPNAESPSPLQVLTAEDIAASGVTNLQELLLKNPTLGTPAISRTNSNFGTSSVGVATIDLRNLGTARTLVLVNGRRFVSGVPGDSAVDFNSIPTDFIERIEILTGGASSTYGSDAVAGVVNIILKRDFEGVAISTQAGVSARSDDKQKRFGITFGATAPEGRGNVMGYIGYSDQGSVKSKDRSFSAIDQASLGAFVTGDPNDLFTVRRPFFSSFAPQGRFFTENGPGAGITFDRDGNVIPWSTNGPAGDGVGATGFNRSEFRSIAVPTERFLFAGKGDYSITDKHSAFFEASYAATQTVSVLEPYPLGAEDIYPARGGQVPAEFLVNGVITRNPLVPDAIYDTATDSDGDGLRDYYFTRRMAEVGTRGNVADRDTYRFVTGLKGALTDKLNYEVFGGYGVTKEAQTSSGQVNVLNFRNALEAIPGPDGQPICLDPDAVAQGCVPINVFGFGSISPEALQYVTAPGSLLTYTSQKLYGATVTGEPFSVAAGPVGIAVGAEYRDEFSRSEFDALQQAGLNAGNAIPPTRGSFDVLEVFAEGRLPLLKDAPLAKSLVATAAVRAGDYSTVGKTVSWNTGLEWALNSDVKVRATRALSTRAPNITELFQPPSQDFPTGLNDPCLGVTATSVGARDDACRSDPGVAANIAANGTFTLNQADLQGVSGFDRGNPNVKEEKGNSWTLGLVFTPTADLLKNFAFTVDYFNIKIDDAIVETPRQFILEQCYGGDAGFCEFITRRPTDIGANSAGSLEFIDAGVSNSGNLVTEGLDFTVAYAANLGPGRLNARLSWTHLLEAYETPLPGAPRDSFKGEIGAAKNKGSLALNYRWGDFGFTSQTTFIGKSSLDDQFLAAFGKAPRTIGVKEKIYNDFQLTYAPAKFAQVYFGIDNAFDTKPAPIISGLPGNDTGTETHAGAYDPIGRRYYAGLRLKF
ncbi:MAG: TonB-dependent receptor [Pseudomonadota bacterium]